jgi:hypothetical protein
MADAAATRAIPRPLLVVLCLIMRRGLMMRGAALALSRPGPAMPRTALRRVLLVLIPASFGT